MNLSCGGGFEIWQFTGRTPAMQPESKIGDIGIFAVKIRAENNGYSFSIDSQGSFPMEDAAGRFCYIEYAMQHS